MGVEFHVGNVLDVLRDFPDASFDASFADPPYGLNFMGKKWDADVPSVDICREVFRVLKPGAPLLWFGGTKTFPWMAVRLAEAGFEPRDTLFWLYGEGMPKNHNISASIDKIKGVKRRKVGSQKLTGNAALSTAEKGGTFGVGAGSVGPVVVDRTAGGCPESAAWDGHGTALTPAVEPLCLMLKPREGGFAKNALKHGVGGLNIDGCRIGEPEDKTPAPKRRVDSKPWFTSANENAGGDDSKGLWPKNVLLSHSADCTDFVCAQDCPVRGVEEQSPGASRYFYQPKVSREERDFGCDEFPLVTPADAVKRDEDSVGMADGRAGAGRTGGGVRNPHATLKPIALTEYFAKLVLPPGNGRLLVPFSGAGSECIGAVRAGWREIVGIELDPKHVAIAKARVRAWSEIPHLARPPKKAEAKQVSIFDVIDEAKHG